MSEGVATAPPPAPSLGEAFMYWLKLGFISFGGPAGQISIMHQELVERRRWISEHRFLHALNYCMLLPGPEAIQLAIYISWLLHGVRGAVIAGVLFFVPAFVLLSLLAGIYLSFGNVSWVQGVFHGIKPAVVAVVLFAAGASGRGRSRTVSCSASPHWPSWRSFSSRSTSPGSCSRRPSPAPSAASGCRRSSRLEERTAQATRPMARR
jgi:chromate transport protein ChrA